MNISSLSPEKQKVESEARYEKIILSKKSIIFNKINIQKFILRISYLNRIDIPIFDNREVVAENLEQRRGVRRTCFRERLFGQHFLNLQQNNNTSSTTTTLPLDNTSSIWNRANVSKRRGDLRKTICYFLSFSILIFPFTFLGPNPSSQLFLCTLHFISALKQLKVLLITTTR